jgi:Tol biopolymer transport system component
MRRFIIVFIALSLLLSACSRVNVSVVTPLSVTPTDSAVEVSASQPSGDVLAAVNEPAEMEAIPSSANDPLGELYFYTMTASATGRANFPYHLVRLPGSCVVGLTACAEPEEVVPPFPFHNSMQSLSWSPDGSVGALVYNDDAAMLSKLWFFDPVAQTWTSMFEATYIAPSPGWSPDGNWIVFMTMNDREIYELYAIQRNGSGLKMLTSLSSLPNTGYPYIMDGWVAGNIVLRLDGLESGQAGPVYLVSLIDGQLQALPETLAAKARFTPSNDAAWLAYGEYNSESQTYTLFMAGPDGANPVQLTSFPNDASGVPIVWSPDNNRLAFVQDDSGPGKGSTVEVSVINRDGTGQIEVCRPRDTAGGMMFSPDGKFLLVNEMGGDGSIPGRIFVVNLETLEQHILEGPGLPLEIGRIMTSWRK